MRVNGTLAGLATMLALTAVASPGFAQEFGSKGDVVFSAERVFGFQSTHVEEDPEGPADEYDNDWTYFGIGWRGTYISDFSPYDVPRFGFDFLVIDGLSIGGSVGFASIKGDDGPFVDNDGSAFLLVGRVGYVHMFNEVIGIWPRGGLNYHSFNVDDSFDENGFGLNLECMFPIVPRDYWGFLVGPTVDLDVGGGRDYEPGGESDRTYRTIGIQAGLFGWL